MEDDPQQTIERMEDEVRVSTFPFGFSSRYKLHWIHVAISLLHIVDNQQGEQGSETEVQEVGFVRRQRIWLNFLAQYLVCSALSHYFRTSNFFPA
jgi:hypothetical protein